ncbi:(2Fe-2S)-binding protein [Amycolatopsis methanolica]|uniref:(2Fe-2S)-binding domain protein n=1 Tax=Amycolatopsis methanolica 239 TaxID=1068978 RepID=A0A076MQH6_AMYME|nr:(2Fe-2S)-binding protein [Amycolatopsis methanolica]AIJ21201.1 (2Fe-2S)-binding domain protein [Amycolatopsis methanolica 239]
MKCSFTLNGRAVEAEIDGLTPLLRLVRDHAGTGTKLGCGEGRCGACTVLVDGEPVASCLYPAANVEGRQVRSIESIAAPDAPLSPVQDALLDGGAVQCGACIPGVVMTLTALLEKENRPSEERVRTELVGNICRCTGYHKIVESALAVTTASEEPV